MGHAPRQQGAGLTYHVTARGNDRQPIFEDDRDRRSFSPSSRRPVNVGAGGYTPGVS